MYYSKIIIAGDSWGVGEWDRAPDRVTHIINHQGLEQYFKDTGYNVINLSKGGYSNTQSIAPLPKESDSVIIWIQTDPLRDLRPYDRFKEKFQSYQTLLDIQKELLTTTYSILNKLGKIYCIGGCSKLDLDLIKEFENLIPIIPSVPEFLLPNYIHPKIWFSDWYELVDRQFDIDSIDKLLYNKKIQDSLADSWEYFQPDGKHPNRHGHKKIFEYLNENIFRQP